MFLVNDITFCRIMTVYVKNNGVLCNFLNFMQ